MARRVPPKESPKEPAEPGAKALFPRFREGYQAGTLLLVSLILVLGLIGNKSSFESFFRVLPSGKTPRPSRRAQPPEVSLRATLAKVIEEGRKGLSKKCDWTPLFAEGTRIADNAPSRERLSSRQTTPDYLNFFSASQIGGCLSPPL